jgi:hypothetical protein
MSDETTNESLLDRDLSEEEATFLRESIETWKEEVMANLLAEAEEAKNQKLEELEEQNIEYKEKVKEEYATKMLEALKELKEEIRAEVLGEVYENNPELQILEKIKELVAPTLNEEYLGNIFAEEIQTLREENEKLKEEMKLEEGARKLAELVAPYTEKTQNILISLIKEGGPEEITEQFYEIIESLELDDDDEEEEYEDDEEEVEEDSDENSEPYITEDSKTEEPKKDDIQTVKGRISRSAFN